LTNPLMLCGARLIFFSAIAAGFFGAYGGDILFSLYALGIILALIIASILRKTLLRGEISPFVLELPVYQRPSLRVAVTRMWDRGSLFFRNAGRIILVGLLILGALATISSSTLGFTENAGESLAAAFGRLLQPVFQPLNWDWRLIVAALFGFVAKEVVLGASAMLYGAGQEDLARRLAELYSPVDIYGYMVFILIYVPCLATVAAIRHETGSWKWALFTVAYGVILAYLLNFLIVSVGHFLLG